MPSWKQFLKKVEAYRVVDRNAWCRNDASYGGYCGLGSIRSSIYSFAVFHAKFPSFMFNFRIDSTITDIYIADRKCLLYECF